MNNNSPIGIFDSGVGGLTVLKEVSRLLPSENILYFGDTARVPYGIRSAETIKKYFFECADFLLQKGIKFLIVACNTVSAIVLENLKYRIRLPAVGVIYPGAMASVIASKNKKIGIIGTEATIKSNAYSNTIKAINPKMQIVSIACPLFVPIIEEGWIDGEITELVTKKYLSYFNNTVIDTIILGCTHYPLLKPTIQKVLKNIVLIDSAIETARVTKQTLININLTNKNISRGITKFFVTDSIEKFVQIGERFLGEKIFNIEKVQL